jgi:hypothetical protein
VECFETFFNTQGSFTFGTPKHNKKKISVETPDDGPRPETCRVHVIIQLTARPYNNCAIGPIDLGKIEKKSMFLCRTG